MCPGRCMWRVIVCKCSQADGYRLVFCPNERVDITWKHVAGTVTHLVPRVPCLTVIQSLSSKVLCRRPLHTSPKSPLVQSMIHTTLSTSSAYTFPTCMIRPLLPRYDHPFLLNLGLPIWTPLSGTTRARAPARHYAERSQVEPLHVYWYASHPQTWRPTRFRVFVSS